MKTEDEKKRVYRIYCPNCKTYNTISYQELLSLKENNLQLPCKYCNHILFVKVKAN